MKSNITNFKIFTALAMLAAGAFACKANLSPQSTTYAMELSNSSSNYLNDYPILDELFSRHTVIYNYIEEIENLCNEENITKNDIIKEFNKIKNEYIDYCDKQGFNLNSRTSNTLFFKMKPTSLYNVEDHFLSNYHYLENYENILSEYFDYYVYNKKDNQWVIKYGTEKFEKLQELRKLIKQFFKTYDKYKVNTTIGEFNRAVQSLEQKLANAIEKASIGDKNYFKKKNKRNSKENENMTKLFEKYDTYKAYYDTFTKAYSELDYLKQTLKRTVDVDEVKKPRPSVPPANTATAGTSLPPATLAVPTAWAL